MRIAAVPDVHGTLPALRAVPDDVRGRGRRPRAMQSGTRAARYAMLQRDSGPSHAQQPAVDYDPVPAAAPARDRDLDEWAVALRGGRLSP